MIQKKTTLLTSLGILLVSFCSFANENAPAPTQSLPIPIDQKTPQLSSHHIGHQVEMTFVVKPDGRTARVRPVESYRSLEQIEIAAAMTHALRQWQFKPAKDLEGNPLSVQVVLPVKIVQYGDTLNLESEVQIAQK